MGHSIKLALIYVIFMIATCYATPQPVLDLEVGASLSTSIRTRFLNLITQNNHNVYNLTVRNLPDYRILI